MHTKRTRFLGVSFDPLDMNEVLGRLGKVTAGSGYTYWVTPNVDHVVRLNQPIIRSSLLSLYENADFCLCDSRVLRLIARAQGINLSVVPGSDLTSKILYQLANPGDRIAVVGADQALMDDLAARFPDIVFLHFAPPMGLRTNPLAIDQAARFIATSHARFTLIAVGSPQQEMIASAVRNISGASGAALCIGASLEFITGRKRRAPVWIQKLSLEWAHRLTSEPRRMWRRYLIEGPRILLLAARYRRNGTRR